MPPAIRARSQAGLRMGQFLAFAVVMMTLTIAAATHSKLMVSKAQDQLFETSQQAEQVFAIEARTSELRHELESVQQFANRYERLAFPLQVSDVLASVVNLLPDSVTLDEVNLDAGARVIGRGPRSQGVASTAVGAGADDPPRLLIGEVSGFAADDQQIAELVSALETTPPFENVSLDFSRSRRVNDRDAREFRLSFRIDLDDTYHVTHMDDRVPLSPDAADGRSQEVANVDN